MEDLADALEGVGIRTTGWDLVRNALREFANPRDPKPPEEPLGLGAVVEDADGRRWVRADDDDPEWRRADGDGRWRYWSQVNAVRILSDGYEATP